MTTDRPSGLGSKAFLAAGQLLRRQSMRPVTRVASSVHAALYAMTGGKAQHPRYPTMVLTVTGRKTGKARKVPLVYVKDGDDFVIAAAYSGSDTNPTWWLNLRDCPDALVEVNGTTVPVRCELAPAGRRDDLWRRLVDMYPYFTDYQSRTEREIPVGILKPSQLR